MSAWMVYAAVVGGLFGVAAAALEWVTRSAGRCGRWLWAAAMAASLGVPLVAPLRDATPATVPAGASAIDAAGAVLSREAVSVLRRVADVVDPWLAPFWLVASLTLAGALVAGLARLRGRTRGWPEAVVGERSVLLSTGFGPAVVGVLRPRIVLPGWMLSADAGALAMALLHEEEHRRAGDVRLLFAAAAAVVIAPWNPALWWQLRRLRAAVELDCDARVLARGAGRAAYGSLLLDLAAGARPAPLPFAALSTHTTLLERRLRMITRGPKRIGRLTAAAACALAIGAVGLACDAAPPTEPAAEAGLTETVPPGPAATVAPAAEGAAEAKGRIVRLSDEGDTAPLIFVDGVRMGGADALSDLAPEAIERIEVLKGAAARGLYGEEAAAGVINVFLKQPAS